MNADQFFEYVDYGDGIVGLCMSRIPVNALDFNILSEVSQVFKELAVDQECRAVVITSALKVFSAGMDIKAAQSLSPQEQNKTANGFNSAFYQMFACPKPVIAAVNGPAIAGGAFFVLAADYRIGTSRSKFGLAEVRAGVDFPIGPLEIARNTLSPNDLRRLSLTGDPMSARAAERAGILDEITQIEALESRAVDVARKLADHSPDAYARIKQQLRGDCLQKIEYAMRNGANENPKGWFTEETPAAMQKLIGV